MTLIWPNIPPASRGRSCSHVSQLMSLTGSGKRVEEEEEEVEETSFPPADEELTF